MLLFFALTSGYWSDRPSVARAVTAGLTNGIAQSDGRDVDGGTTDAYVDALCCMKECIDDDQI